LHLYADAVRKVAEQEDVTYINLLSLSEALLSTMTQEQADEFNAVGHADQRVENGKTAVDRTHLDDKGKKVFGRMVADNIVRTQVELGPDLIGVPAATATPQVPMPSSAADASHPESAFPGYIIWPQGKPPADSPQKLALGTHSWALAHREASGEVETHETRDIVMIVQSGDATLIVGNDVINPTHPSPDEMRGTAIRNGVERKVSAGDVINMPAGLPHQFVLEPGHQITYIDVVVPAPRSAPTP
jgi:mannose-6-phosphate isomerase-like protein (cupin superfamily)